MADKKNKFTDYFIGKYPQAVANSIHCSGIGRVSKYDKKDHTCSIQLLSKPNGNKLPPLIQVIVPATIYQTDDIMTKLAKKNSLKYQPMKVGSIVSVGFFDTDIDEFDGKNEFDSDSKRSHSLNDAFLIGVINP